MSSVFDYVSAVSAVIAVGGILASVISAYLSGQEQRRIKEEAEHYRNVYKKSFSAYFDQLEKSRPDLKSGDNWSKLIKEFYISSVSDLAQVEYLSEKETQIIIDEKVHSLKYRIEEIESRFPSQDTIEKIASVNDAILATQIENLSEKINALEKSKLSKWDVAIVVFQIISALGVFCGVGFGIISYLSKTTGG